MTEPGHPLPPAQQSRVRYCDTIGGDSPGRIRERFAKLAAAVGIPVETHCHNDLGMAVANSVSGALGDLDAGQDAWVNTCVNGIGERAGNADLLSCILAFSYGFGISESVAVGDRLDLSWAASGTCSTGSANRWPQTRRTWCSRWSSSARRRPASR